MKKHLFISCLDWCEQFDPPNSVCLYYFSKNDVNPKRKGLIRWLVILCGESL